MQFWKPFWSFLLSHGLIFLASALFFLLEKDGTLNDRISILAFLFLAAAVIQGIVLWKKKSRGFNWFLPLLIIFIDVALGGLILYAPDQSLRIYILILVLWSALMGFMLLFHFGVKEPYRAGMAAAGIMFLLLGGYTATHLGNPEGIHIQLLGVLSLVFSIFLIYISLQLRFQKAKPEKIKDFDDQKMPEEDTMN